MAPGIVATATSSTFAFGLSQADICGGAQNLIPIAFVVIVADACIYGLMGAWLARSASRARAREGFYWLVRVRSDAQSGAPSKPDELTVCCLPPTRSTCAPPKLTGSGPEERPTQDATEPPRSTGSTMPSRSVTMRPSTRWSRPTCPSTSVAVTYSNAPGQRAVPLARAERARSRRLVQPLSADPRLILRGHARPPRVPPSWLHG